jgi:ADP-ribose pyrophosphatase YjhB (NUDIX family)
MDHESLAAMPEEPELVSTSAAARAVGVGRSTLWRWINLGYVEPHTRTAGGHLRWNIPRLRQQVSAIRNKIPESTSTPQPQPTVAAIVTSHLGVLARRRRDKKPWTFITSEIEPDESAADAAVRKVKQETGLEVRAGHHEIGRCDDPTGRPMIYLACTPVQGADALAGAPSQQPTELRWLSLTEVATLMPDVFKPVREHLGRLIS